jgi:hypothetical protein
MPLYLAQFSPSFIAPGLAVAGAIAVAIPILIHILSRRPRKPEPWAAMRFLLAAYQKHRMRTRLEQLLLLATRCLLVLMIGLALAGPLLSAFASLSGLGGSGRTVVLILDHSLTSATRTAEGPQRLTALRQTAASLIAALGPSDRIALISAARPVRAVIAPATVDAAAVTRQIELLGPVEAAADWPAALTEALAILKADTAAAGREAVVAMIGDMSRGSMPTETPLPPQLRELSTLAKLLVLDPAGPAPNVQIASLEPDRRVIVSDATAGQASVAWTIALRRFAGEAAPAELSTVRIEAPDMAPIRRNVNWQPGQTQAELRLDVPVSTAAAASIAVTASLEPAVEGFDMLEADNIRHAVVRTRPRLTILLLDRRDATDAALTPRRWLTTALAPVGDRLGWPIEVRQADAANISAESLRDIDAAIILRPDLLIAESWATLVQWSQRGSLLWVFPPADAPPTLWPQSLGDALGVTWSINLEPLSHDPPLKLTVDHAGSPEMSRLRADLPDLLRPVDVSRRLVIDGASLGPQTQVMLRGAGGEPVMIAVDTPGGGGRVLLSSVAVDDAWTNLPTKPLFVPLVHEVIRGAIDRMEPTISVRPGDQPLLSAAWSAAGRLTAPDGREILLTTDGPSKAVRPLGPIAQAGLYRSTTDVLAVNLDADAADTRPVEAAALKEYLDPLGQWTVMKSNDPAGPLAQQRPLADLSWPALWAVAFLAIAEMLLARHASHASTTHRTADARSLLKRPA